MQKLSQEVRPVLALRQPCTPADAVLRLVAFLGSCEQKNDLLLERIEADLDSSGRKCDRGNPCGSCRDRNEAGERQKVAHDLTGSVTLMDLAVTDQCSWDDAIRVPPEYALPHPLATPSGRSPADVRSTVHRTATRGVEALELRSQLDRLEGLLGALMGGHNDSGGPVFPVRLETLPRVHPRAELMIGRGQGSNSTHAHLAELVSARSGGYSPLDGVSGPYAPTLHHLGPTSTSTSGSIRPGSDAYARLAGLLPPPEALHELLTFFRSHILYLLPVVHFPTLLSRVANFDRSPSAARQDRDPAFLALLLAMTGIARTAKGTQVEYATAMTGYTGFSAGAEVQGCSPADGKVGAAMRSGKELVDAAVESLRLSECVSWGCKLSYDPTLTSWWCSYMAHPTLDCIRVLVLLNHFHRFDSSTKPILILSEALTLARAMELNRDPTKTNPAEGRIEVEERRRLWAMLKAAEATQGPGRGLAGMLGEADTEVSLAVSKRSVPRSGGADDGDGLQAPANANDEDVTPTSVKVYPITTLTDSTPLLILIEVGELARERPPSLHPCVNSSLKPRLIDRPDHPGSLLARRPAVLPDHPRPQQRARIADQLAPPSHVLPLEPDGHGRHRAAVDGARKGVVQVHLAFGAQRALRPPASSFVRPTGSPLAFGRWCLTFLRESQLDPRVRGRAVRVQPRLLPRRRVRSFLALRYEKVPQCLPSALQALHPRVPSRSGRRPSGVVVQVCHCRRLQCALYSLRRSLPFVVSSASSPLAL